MENKENKNIETIVNDSKSEIVEKLKKINEEILEAYQFIKNEG